MLSIRRVLVVATVVCLSVVLMPGSASASLYQPPERYSYEDVFDPECAEIDIEVSARGRGISWTENVDGSDGQAFLAHDRYTFEEVWTNTANGEWFTVSGHGYFRETAAVLVPNNQVPADLIPPGGLVGPVYEFTAVDSGNPLAVHDSDGDLVFSDRGSLTFKLLFDTVGDHQPGGAELSFEVVKVVGNFPGLDVDMCELAVDLVG